MEKYYKVIDDKVTTLDKVMKELHEEEKHKRQAQTDRIQGLENVAARLENRAELLDGRLDTEVGEVAELRKGLTGIESEQLPAVVQPILEQLNETRTDIQDLKNKLREKATIFQVDDMQKEVDKKADLVVHGQLVTEVDGLKEKCDENQKDL